MKTIRNFFRAIDIFGITYSFRYKDREKYKTAFGGFILSLFIIVVCVLGIYYLIPFINRKNYSIVYNIMNLATTEEINLFMGESNIAIGLKCDIYNNENINVNDILDLKSNFIIYTKNLDGSYKKEIKGLTTHSCSYDDFYNKYDKQVDYLGLQKFECLDDKNYTVQGIFTDQLFSYIEFSVVAKNKSEDLLFKINRFLFQNDCKMQLAHTEIIIDLDNYTYPITQYLDVTFIQLSPTLFIKRNAFFMNQFFTDDNHIMFIFGDDEQPEKKILYSRYEEYSLWKGFNRSIYKPHSYDYYSKIYIRADLKKSVIKRKYQKFTEFYADVSSVLVTLYEILVIILEYIDTFYAFHSLSKKIFFFKDLEHSNHFNIFRKNNSIKEIVSLINLKEKKSNINLKIQNNNKIANNIKEITNDNKLEIYKKQKYIKINNNKRIISNEKKLKNNNYNSYNINISKKLDSENNNNNNPKEYDKENNPKLDNSNFIFKNKNSVVNLNFITCDRDHLESIDSKGSNIEDISSRGDDKRKKKIKNSFNILEIIISQFFKFLMCQNISIKKDANQKAKIILYKKMDIITYIRNMLLFDIINKTIINNNNNHIKYIINFLCRPIISKDNKYDSELDIFYERFREKDFNKFNENIRELIDKSHKDLSEYKLISFSKDHLKCFT